MGDQEKLQSERSAVSGGDHFAALDPGSGKTPLEYTDGRPLWEWKSKYPTEARHMINCEAYALAALLATTLVGDGICLGIAGERDHYFMLLGVDVHCNFRVLATFFTGCVGGTTFSIKWLIHSVAKGKWHLDRRYWRFLVPAIGGVYACVVMTLFGAGLFATQSMTQEVAQGAPMSSTAALAFLVGYFSDGVSGLLSNIANAVFGTLEKK